MRAEPATDPDNPATSQDDAVYYRTMPRYPYLQEMKDKLLNSSQRPSEPEPEPESELSRMEETVQLAQPAVAVIKLTPDRYAPAAVPGNLPKNAKTACFRTFSLVYAMLLVVVCIAFLVSEIITNNVPLYFYEAFFTYLYGVGILFLLYVFIYLLHESSSKVGKQEAAGCCGKGKDEKQTADENLNGGEGGSPDRLTAGRPYKTKTSDNEHSHGGFFLRIGAIAFGLATMVYNGLELGTFFELPEDSDCRQLIMAVNPCLQAAFTFMQMYFIFMNSRLNIHKFKALARCGLMHLAAANLCVWVRTVVRESLRVYTHHRQITGQAGSEDYLILGASVTPYNVSCGRESILGSIVADSSPFLFPLVVEYSLIGAAVLFVMWQNVGRCPRFLEEDDIPDHVSVTSRKAHTKVDCIGASKGLFCGLLVLVGAVICLVLYFVLMEQRQHQDIALFLADASHAAILLLMMFATLIGFCRSRRLKYVQDRPDQLDVILQRVSAFGLLLYSSFCLLAAAMSPLPHVPNLLVLITSSLAVLQVTLQLLYIHDALKRAVYLSEHDVTKPGRQVVTFLLLCNLALWAVYTMEVKKVHANPVQEDFYGRLHWAVIVRVVLPLTIFHRFHSSVALAEVWKSSYKARAD